MILIFLFDLILVMVFFGWISWILCLLLSFASALSVFVQV